MSEKTLNTTKMEESLTPETSNLATPYAKNSLCEKIDALIKEMKGFTSVIKYRKEYYNFEYMDGKKSLVSKLTPEEAWMHLQEEAEVYDLQKVGELMYNSKPNSKFKK